MLEMLELGEAGIMPEDIPELEYDFLGEYNLIEELLECNLINYIGAESE